MPTTVFPGPTPKEAINWFRKKKLKPAFDYRDVWRTEHRHAFTVAKAMELDILTDIRDAIDQALAEGKTFQQFKSELQPLLQQKGWWGIADMRDPVTGKTGDVQLGSPHRLRTIYRTNLRTARAAGQWHRIKRTQKALPYLVYRLGPSEVHREQHVKWESLVLPASSKFWQTHFPPNGWGCKCRVRQITEAEAKRLGGPHKPPVIETKQWTNKRTGEVVHVADGIDPGWDYNPGAGRAAGLNKNLKQSESRFKKAITKPLPKPIDQTFPANENLVFSTVKKLNQTAIADSLQKIPGAEKQVAKVAEFLNAHNTKSLILKQSEMGRGKASIAIEKDVGEFLGKDAPSYVPYAYTTRRPSRVGGFTSQAWNHIVVKAKASDRLDKLNPADMKQSVELATSGAQSSMPSEWSISSAMDTITDKQHPSVVPTWLHELGHQVHYKAGLPAKPASAPQLTVYSMTNDREWHAEHFAAWVLNRKALAQWHPETAEYFDNLLDKAIIQTTKE